MPLIQELTYGYKIPQTGATGQSVFDALEENIRKVNAHDHDGINSKKLNSSNFEGIVFTPPWGNSEDLYSKEHETDYNYSITFNFSENRLDSGINLLNKSISFRDITDKTPIFLEYRVVNARTLTVYCPIIVTFEVLIV